MSKMLLLTFTRTSAQLWWTCVHERARQGGEQHCNIDERRAKTWHWGGATDLPVYRCCPSLRRINCPVGESVHSRIDLLAHPLLPPYIHTYCPFIPFFLPSRGFPFFFLYSPRFIPVPPCTPSTLCTLVLAFSRKKKRVHYPQAPLRFIIKGHKSGQV